MEAVLSRITTNPRQCGGRPCIRGMRIRVPDILQLFAAGISAEQLLAEMPNPEAADLQAALQHAARYRATKNRALVRASKEATAWRVLWPG